MRFPLILVLSIFFSRQLIAGDGIQIYNDSTFIYRTIDEAMVHPDRVFRLNLSKQKIDTFPLQILLCKNLIELDMSKNRMEEIPPGIGELTNLKKLNLSNNKLVHLPDEIGKLTELVYLSLNRNVLEDIPTTIGQLNKLEVLELWDNELNGVPDEIADLQNLKLLELRGILFSDEDLRRIDSLVVKTAKINMSPSCNCKN